ncbi:MAG: polyphosphate:AMP phosphotransferase [Defluviitaleaceae bacterium]|nr:polyphosphate:AMP phosphotransferase [Defluviitaleaceae bacterium]MCL2837367.1 polyphosphate:AMP phosphotransferase [Defluviitaleaceae bacterium]
MLESVSSRTEPDKVGYQQKMDILEKKLGILQLRLRELGIPVAILFDGWSAAGKGSLINRALSQLDPRYFKVHPMERVTEDQLLRPFLWSYAQKMPAAGQIAIFDKSYYMALMPESGMLPHKKNAAGTYQDIRAFENQLLDSGAIILKYFLHVNKDEQARRFKELMRSEDTRWRVTEKDLAQNIQYSKFYAKFNEIFIKTKDCPAQWVLLNANDKRSAALGFFEHVTAALESAVQAKTDPPEPSVTAALPAEYARAGADVPDILSSITVNKPITDERYAKLLKQYQNQMSVHGYKLYRKRRAAAVIYEGWDASGKGGSIKRLIQEMDPRGYNVVPVSKPTAEEFSHHYLWRFWREMPKDGHMTIFDRSWYGRVLVERVEGFCAESEWKRAYQEINDMELHLHRHGVIVLKFWLHVSSEEQLRRFNARLDDPAKQHKICDEDWRNRARWDDYYAAVNEMLHRTSTAYAPWVVVESDSKKFARIKVLEHVAKMLAKEL